MDPATLRLLDAAVVSLGLDRPVHPWGLTLEDGCVREAVRVPVPVVFDRVLAPAIPSPSDLAQECVLEAFPPRDRAHVAAQIDASYEMLHVLRREPRSVRFLRESNEIGALDGVGGPVGFIRVQIGPCHAASGSSCGLAA